MLAVICSWEISKVKIITPKLQSILRMISIIIVEWFYILRCGGNPKRCEVACQSWHRFLYFKTALCLDTSALKAANNKRHLLLHLRYEIFFCPLWAMKGLAILITRQQLLFCSPVIVMKVMKVHNPLLFLQILIYRCW